MYGDHHHQGHHRHQGHHHQGHRRHHQHDYQEYLNDMQKDIVFYVIYMFYNKNSNIVLSVLKPPLPGWIDTSSTW